MAPTIFHTLCNVCQTIPDLVSQPKSLQSLRAFTREQLDRSVVDKRCHVCCKLQGLLAKDRKVEEPVGPPKILTLDVHQFQGRGISNVLFVGDEKRRISDSISFHFENAAGEMPVSQQRWRMKTSDIRTQRQR
jgi:hypothetical protein